MFDGRNCSQVALKQTAVTLFCYDISFSNREKKNRGYSSGKRMFKINAAAKKKPRRHNTEVSLKWKTFSLSSSTCR